MHEVWRRFEFEFEIRVVVQGLEAQLEELTAHSDMLLKENDAIKAEMHNNKFSVSAHNIFLEMKEKEERDKSLALEQQVEVLQDELLKKKLCMATRRGEAKRHQAALGRQHTEHQAEMLRLSNKLSLLTQLSQEEIEQTFHVTIQELQSLLLSDEQEQEQEQEQEAKEEEEEEERKEAPQGEDKPHITDSDVGSNDAVEIREAEHKLAAYFARHKQRQQQGQAGLALKEVDEDKVVIVTEVQQMVEIVEDDTILTPPLSQEEPPYIVDDNLSVDRTETVNASVSNIANSNHSRDGDKRVDDTAPIIGPAEQVRHG